MEAIAMPQAVGAVDGLGFLVRRQIDRWGETGRLQRRAPAFDLDRERRDFRTEVATVLVVVAVLPRSGLCRFQLR